MANPEHLEILKLAFVLEFLVASGVGTTTPQSHAVGRKSLAQPFKAG